MDGGTEQNLEWAQARTWGAHDEDSGDGDDGNEFNEDEDSGDGFDSNGVDDDEGGGDGDDGNGVDGNDFK